MPIALRQLMLRPERGGGIMELSQYHTQSRFVAPNASLKINPIGINRMFSLKIYEAC